MDEIKAIETHYRGRRFRSRLEARWAVFFDFIGIEQSPEYAEIARARIDHAHRMGRQARLELETA